MNQQTITPPPPEHLRRHRRTLALYLQYRLALALEQAFGVGAPAGVREADRLAFTVTIDQVCRSLRVSPELAREALAHWDWLMRRTRPHIRVNPLPDGASYQIAYVLGGRQREAA